MIRVVRGYPNGIFGGRAIWKAGSGRISWIGIVGIEDVERGPFGRLDLMLRWRVLVQYLTLSTLKAGQHNTILGYVWWVLDPLLLMLVYFVLVEVIFQRGVEHYPVFVLCAVVPWKWFSSSLLGSMASLVGKERLIKQVVFPKIVLPLSQVLSNLVSFAFGLGVLFLFVLGSGIAIKPIVLALPVVIAGQFLLVFGLALLLSSLNIFFRDVQNLSAYGLRLWFYMSPSLYTVELVPDQFRSVYGLNPFAHVFPAYRDLLMEGRFSSLTDLAWIFGSGTLVLVIGYIAFKWAEPRFAKVL